MRLSRAAPFFYLFYKYIKGDSECLLSPFSDGFDGILYMLNAFWCSYIWRIDDGYAFLAIRFVFVQNDNTAFFLLACMHNAEIETVG